MTETDEEFRARFGAAYGQHGNGGAPDEKPIIIDTLGDYLARRRAPIKPLIATHDGRTVLLAVENALLLAGPSGHGKTLASFDLCGLLASEQGGHWLGLHVVGGQTVLILPFEGADEDNVKHLGDLVSDDAYGRLHVWNRWVGGADLPRADDITGLAGAIREYAVDVLIIDTGSAFFGRDFSVGGGEDAALVIDELRALSGRRFAVIVVAHTKKADRSGAKVDELEEVSGLFGRKADAAIVIRKVGNEPDTPKRHITFAKVRKGPGLRQLLAELPAGDSDDPPRLKVIGEAGRPVKEGSDADAVAAWVRGHDEPQAATVICARFEISAKTLQNRRAALEEREVTRGPLPGRGKTQGYGTVEQWQRVNGVELG